MSVNEIAPVRVPLAFGVKVTEMVQLALDARLVPQLFVCAKSPETLTPLIESAPLPLFVKRTVCAALLVFTD